MLRILCTFLFALTFHSAAWANPNPVSLTGGDASCESFEDLDTISFRFFNPTARIEGRFLIVSIDDSFYRCAEKADGSLSYIFERQTETSALEAQYWTLFTTTSWGASFIGGKIIRSASVEIPIRKFLTTDEYVDYKNGNPISKTLYLFLNSPMSNGISQGHFHLDVELHSGVATITSFY